MILTGIFIALIIILAYHRINLRLSSLVLLIVPIIYTFFILYSCFINSTFPQKTPLSLAKLSLLILVWLGFLVIFIILNISGLRKKLFSQRIFNWYKKIKPEMSLTEKEALEAGTISFEAELFNGKPDWKKLANIPVSQLSPEEKAFIAGPVEELCLQLNDWDISHYKMDLPAEIWQFIKDNGFFGLIIPKEYGGKAFSAYAHTQILTKICGVSMSAGTTISVPNSLGPAELLLHYGTVEQKENYLPKLARGEEIPCFALTGPEAGSDAGSIPDTGIVCKGLFDGKEIIGINLNWNKRYITLAPCATVMGLAFKLSDPDFLLDNKLENNKTEYGITCALIPTHLPGITIGRRHFPLNAAFLNGPIQGKNVFIPLDYIIGGPAMAGHGWRMLVECLSAGRAISLPSLAIGGAKMAVMTTSAYTRIRHQFHLAIINFEGISQVLAQMGGYLYLMEAAKSLTMSIIDQGEKPAVLSAIMKYHMTELGRKIACAAMDIHGGKGICLGPKNYLGRFYQSIPIAITVEGANILTRSLIIFGQGAMRCHRYILKELHAAEKNDLTQFDQAIWGHAGLILSNTVRTLLLGLSQAYMVKNPVYYYPLKRHYQLLTRFSSAFSLIAEASLLVLGSRLKRREKLSGRLGDILSYLYLISAALKYYESQGCPITDMSLVNWVCEQYFYNIQQTLEEILQNFPSKILSIILKFLIFPWGKWLKPPSDKLSQTIANLLSSPSPSRDRLTDNVFKGGEVMGKIEQAFNQLMIVEILSKKESITLDEQIFINNTLKLCQEITAVDDFSSEELLHR